MELAEASRRNLVGPNGISRCAMPLGGDVIGYPPAEPSPFPPAYKAMLGPGRAVSYPPYRLPHPASTCTGPQNGDPRVGKYRSLPRRSIL